MTFNPDYKCKPDCTAHDVMKEWLEHGHISKAEHDRALSAKDAEIAELRRVLGVAKGAIQALDKSTKGKMAFNTAKLRDEAITEIEKAGV